MMPADAAIRKPLRTTPEAQLAPAHTALLVIDVQNDFCADGGFIDQVLGKDMSACQAVPGPIMKLVAAARETGVYVAWVRAIYDRETQAAPVLAKQAQIGVDRVCCAAGSWGADFFGVTPETDEPVIEKHRYSAFSGTPLDQRLRENGVETLVLAGVQTNVCIESTLREGFSLGYYIVIPEDAVASHTPALHDATLANVRALFGTVMPGGEIGKIWRGA